jgi:hypothetical protein
MADVTISGLSLASPNKDTAIIPFSDGSTTYKTSPSGIVAASPGSVIQTVCFNNPETVTVSSNPVYFNQASITPRFNTSKILISLGTVIHRDSGGSTTDYYNIELRRGSQFLSRLTDAALFQSTGDGTREFYNTVFLDSPVTTSAVSYGGYVIRMSGGASARVNIGNSGYISMQEIAG